MIQHRWSQIQVWLAGRRAKVRDAAVNVRRAFWLVWQAHRPSALAMLAATLIGAFLPPAQAWVGKLIVDSVVASVNARVGARRGYRPCCPCWR